MENVKKKTHKATASLRKLESKVWKQEVVFIVCLTQREKDSPFHSTVPAALLQYYSKERSAGKAHVPTERGDFSLGEGGVSLLRLLHVQHFHSTRVNMTPRQIVISWFYSIHILIVQRRWHRSLSALMQWQLHPDTSFPFGLLFVVPGRGIWQ